MAATCACPLATMASMESWKACRFARLASLKPRSAAAFGATAVPARAISWRKVVKVPAPCVTRANWARSASGTREPQAARSSFIAVRFWRMRSAYFWASAVSLAA